MHSIANKGFSGMRSSPPTSSFVSIDGFVTPQSFTGHSAIVMHKARKCLTSLIECIIYWIKILII